MGETKTGPGLASYLDDVTELMQAGVPFGDVEDTLDESADLTDDAKAALWLLAFSMRAPGDQLKDAHAHVAALS